MLLYMRAKCTNVEVTYRGYMSKRIDCYSIIRDFFLRDLQPSVLSTTSKCVELFAELNLYVN